MPNIWSSLQCREVVKPRVTSTFEAIESWPPSSSYLDSPLVPRSLYDSNKVGGSPTWPSSLFPFDSTRIFYFASQPSHFLAFSSSESKLDNHLIYFDNILKIWLFSSNGFSQLFGNNARARKADATREWWPLNLENLKSKGLERNDPAARSLARRPISS